MNRLDEVAQAAMLEIDLAPNYEPPAAGPPPWPRDALRGLPPMKQGDRVRCRVCGGVHEVEEAPYRDGRGRALLFAVACGSRRIVVGGQGRSMVGRVEPPEERALGQAMASRFSDADQRLAVRRILLGRSTLEAEAKKRRTSATTVELWLRDPELRGDLRITQQSTWQPKARYTSAFKRQLAERVHKGESPAAIAKEFTDLLPGEIRHWSLGHDLEDDPKEFPAAQVEAVPKPPEPQIWLPDTAAELVAHLEKTRAVKIALRHGDTIEVRPKGVLSRVEGERMYALRAEIIAFLAERENMTASVVVETRHPKRDEAVKALHEGMGPLEIIGALELGITVDALRDWHDEDRAAEVGCFAKPHVNSGRGGRRERIPDEVRDEAIGRLTAGESLKEVCTALGVSEPLVRLWARGANIVIPRHYKPVSKYTPEQRKRFAERRIAGEPIWELAKEAGVAAGTIEHWTREFALRPPARKVHPRRAEVVRRMAAGESIAQVVKACGVSDISVRVWWAYAQQQMANGQANLIPETVPEVRSRVKAEPAAPPARVVPAPAPAPAVVAPRPMPAPAPAPVPVPVPRPAVVAAPPIVAAAAPAAPSRKLKAVTRYACPECDGDIVLPPVVPGQMRMRTGECPHCNAEIDL